MFNHSHVDGSSGPFGHDVDGRDSILGIGLNRSQNLRLAGGGTNIDNACYKLLIAALVAPHHLA